MSHNNTSRVVVAVLMIAFIASASGCGLCKKYKRGMILRGDWAVEINRTPWIGCPPDVGCGGTGCTSETCNEAGCKGSPAPSKNLLSIFNRDANKGETEKKHGFRIACGKRRGCRSQSPCRLSPLCGTFFDMDKPNPVILTMMRNGQLPIPMEVPGVMDLVVGATPSQVSSSGAGQMMPGTLLPPGGSLPAGGMMMTGGAVMRPCGMVPQCTAATPCRTHPQCGVLVPATMLANSSPAVYGNTGFVNPFMGQIVQGITMSGTPQVGYPPIGYATHGYSPGFPQPVAASEETVGVAQNAMSAEENPERVPMPSPRFHSVPTKPTFQRSQGMASRETPQDKDSASASTSAAEIQRAYMKGMYTAMQQQQQATQPSNGLLNGLASTPANLLGFLTDNKAAIVQRQQHLQQQALYQQQQLAATHPATTTPAVSAPLATTNTVATTVKTSVEETERKDSDASAKQDSIAAVAHTDEEPPAPPKKPAPTPKLIQQVSYLDVQ